MVWLIANNLDYKGAKENLNARFPFLEFSAICDLQTQYEVLNVPKSEYNLNTIEAAAKQRSPRFIKTHLPYSLLPDQIKNGTKTPKVSSDLLLQIKILIFLIIYRLFMFGETLKIPAYPFITMVCS